MLARFAVNRKLPSCTTTGIGVAVSMLQNTGPAEAPVESHWAVHCTVPPGGGVIAVLKVAVPPLETWYTMLREAATG